MFLYIWVSLLVNLFVSELEAVKMAAAAAAAATAAAAAATTAAAAAAVPELSHFA